MSAVTPSPAPPLLSPSSNNIQPPSSSTTPSPQQSSANTPQPPSFITSPPLKQPSSPPPNSSLSPPPATSPPPPTRLAPPPTVPSTPPPSQLAPPPTVPSVPPPSQLAPPPTVPSVPPPSQLAPPPSQSPPLSPPVASPPTSPSRPPPPPPPTTPARRSPPPQSSVPPRSSPPPSPPPPFTAPPSNPAPPLASPPGENSPPPAAVPPPRRSPPPPPRNSTSTPPRASPPVAVSPPPPPLFTPPPLSTPPSSTPPPTNSPPSSTTPSSQPAPPSKSTPSSQSAPPPLTRSLPSPPPPQNRSENSSPESESSGGIGTGAVVAIAVCGGILLLGFIGVALWCLKRHKRRNPPNDGYVMPFTLPSSTESESSFLNKLSSAPLIKSNSGSEVVYTPSDTGGMGHSRNWFSYEELIKATNGFSTQNILGEGGFGFVYKGCLPDGREIAVKQLRIGGAQGEKEFKAEVEIISRIHHRHLVSLVGYCIQDNRRLLVYDYVPNNTLHFHLHGEGQPVLEWPNRVKIAAGAARGIAYLHEDCNPRIIHRDIKPSNILLDYNYEARVADFGLAKLVLDTYTPITTRVMGTFGYVAPEYASSGKLTEKSDVYSFGVVLLELITGRKPIDESQSLEDECLVEWARPLLSDALETQKFESLVDPKLEKNYVESEMFCMIQLAAVCVRHSASKRPCMGQVVRAFDSLAASDLTNGMRVGESQALNSTQQAQQRWFQRAAVGSFSTDFFSQESLNT